MLFCNSPEVQAVVDVTPEVLENALDCLVVYFSRIHAELPQVYDRVHDIWLTSNSGKKKLSTKEKQAKVTVQNHECNDTIQSQNEASRV